MNRFKTSDGLNLEYSDEGAGTPILCLPGLTRDAADFDELAAALDGRHRLIRLTLRGRGGSDRDPDFANYNIAVEGRDVVDFLDHIGLDKVVIVGTSRGGLIAMLLAATVKDRLAGVLLNDVGPVIAPEGLEEIMGYLGVAPSAKTFPEVAAALKARMGPKFPGLPDEKWELLARRWFGGGGDGPSLTYDARIRDAMLAQAEGPAGDLWPLFDALSGLPVAVVRGANSNLLAAGTVAEMVARRPDLIVAEVPDRGHVPFLDEPEAQAALAALLERVEV